MTVTREEPGLLTWDDYLALPGETRNTDLIDVPLESGDELTSPLLPGFTVAVGSLLVR